MKIVDKKCMVHVHANVIAQFEQLPCADLHDHHARFIIMLCNKCHIVQIECIILVPLLQCSCPFQFHNLQPRGS